MIWIILIVLVVGIWYYKSKDKDKSTSSSTSSSPSDYSDGKSKQIRPYSMESGAINRAIGAIDKCCEFVAFCEKWVLPPNRFKPERFWCYIEMDESGKISYGFTWKTDCSIFEAYLKDQGYTMGEGFDFSENSGLVSYSGEIINDSAASAYLSETSESEITNEFTRVARNNFESLGLFHPVHVTARDGNGFKSYELVLDF